MIQAFLFAILIANGASAVHVRVIGDPGNGEKIPLDISAKNGYVVTVSGQPDPPQSFFKQSINLYDFDKQLEARKVVEEDVCYIRKFTGTYDQVKEIVNAAKASKGTTQLSEDWNIPGKEIKAKDMLMTVGDKITDFCSGYKVFWVKENMEVTNMPVGMAKRQWKGSLGGGWSQGSGVSVTGGLNYDNGKGLSANLGGGWSQRGGWSASAGLTWRFR